MSPPSVNDSPAPYDVRLASPLIKGLVVITGLVAGILPRPPTSSMVYFVLVACGATAATETAPDTSIAQEDGSRCTSRGCDFPRGKCHAGYIIHIAITWASRP